MIVSYGILTLPNSAGAFELECPTWRPMTGWKDEAFTFYLGGPPKLVNSDPISKDLGKRAQLTSISSGSVHVHCEVIMKNFKELGLSGNN